MLAHVADKVEEKVVLHPVIVVHYLSPVDRVVEIEEARELLTNAVDIVLHLFNRQELTLCSFEGGVANHSGSTAHQSQGLMSSHLEMLEQHDADQMPDME